MRKSALIDIFAQHFDSLKWEGPKFEKGTIFRHLGYPLSINVSTKNKIEWVLRRIRCAPQWPLHIRIRIVQAFLQPYYLLLLDWNKCHLHIFECLLQNFLWNKIHNRALVLSAWKYVCQPKIRGRLGILQLDSHLMAKRVAFIMHIASSQKPLWLDIFWQLMHAYVIRDVGSWMLGSSFHMLGRQCYMGNSFAALSPYWSFLSNPPLAFSLGASARYFNNKGIDSIAKCYDSKWEILSFPAVRRRYEVGVAYRSKWVQLVFFL
ncbi:hypothetical protein KP509_25G061000 [Ceratopteris richardii]|uniref:Uncharacterized protein n=1 Tax=Ceratopteris richardii TaxID=49495 RepID=A0A8T2RQS6_CERRI|nr:hypothetical protein KP509_25G061000 [Ceratopteris richardii]